MSSSNGNRRNKYVRKSLPHKPRPRMSRKANKHTIRVRGQDYDQDIFTCDMNGNAPGQCRRCQFKKAGVQCKKRTCQDRDLCWIHLRKVHRVRIAPSLIKVDGKSVGMGLFAFTEKPLQKQLKRGQDRDKYLIFSKGDEIGIYDAEILSAQELSRRYDFEKDGKLVEQTAPYGVSDSRGNLYDSLCHRNYVSYANDAHKSIFKNNSELKDLNGRLVLLATKNIWMGDEILWSYGKDYWKGPLAKLV